MDSDIEYDGLVAESWDALRGDTSAWADRTFYLELIQDRGEPVLDVGCGTGRLILDFLAQGIDIDGVDNSPEMLAICQRPSLRAWGYSLRYEVGRVTPASRLPVQRGRPVALCRRASLSRIRRHARRCTGPPLVGSRDLWEGPAATTIAGRCCNAPMIARRPITA